MTAIPRGIMPSTIRDPQNSLAQHPRVFQSEPDKSLFGEGHRRPRKWNFDIAHQQRQVFEAPPRRVTAQISLAPVQHRDRLERLEVRTWPQAGISPSLGQLERLRQPLPMHKTAGGEPTAAWRVGKFKHRMVSQIHGTAHTRDLMPA